MVVVPPAVEKVAVFPVPEMNPDEMLGLSLLDLDLVAVEPNLLDPVKALLCVFVAVTDETAFLVAVAAFFLVAVAAFFLDAAFLVAVAAFFLDAAFLVAVAAFFLGFDAVFFCLSIIFII